MLKACVQCMRIQQKEGHGKVFAEAVAPANVNFANIVAAGVGKTPWFFRAPDLHFNVSPYYQRHDNFLQPQFRYYCWWFSCQSCWKFYCMLTRWQLLVRPLFFTILSSKTYGHCYYYDVLYSPLAPTACLIKWTRCYTVTMNGAGDMFHSCLRRNVPDTAEDLAELLSPVEEEIQGLVVRVLVFPKGKVQKERKASMIMRQQAEATKHREGG